MSLHRTFSTSDTRPGSVVRYRKPVFDGARNDPYEVNLKYREPTVCVGCGLVFRGGRWERGETAVPAHAVHCPACRRIDEESPAGYLTLSGPFVLAHAEEVMALVRHEAEQESSEHPLHRLIDVERVQDKIQVTTTDVHLPRRLGRALERAWHGTLDVRQAQDEYLVRVQWCR